MNMKKILLICLAVLMFCSTADARKVKGMVVCGEERLEGVIVTDGKNFTRTQKSGKFVFDIEDKAEFVYIVTPSGYIADWSSGVPAFFQSAEGCENFIFELQHTEKGDDYSIVAVADPQTRNDEHFAKFAAEPMEDLIETAKGLNGPAVGLALGDICWDSLDMLEKYKSEIVRVGIPFYPVAGNHDHDQEAHGDRESTAAYRKLMGPENYAFFIGNDVVIVVDNIIYDTNKKYKEGYAPHVMSWVKGLEALLPEDADLFIAQHASVYLWETKRRIMNSHDFIGLVRGHDVTFLSGHHHINNNHEYEEGVVEHNIAALCGSWWDTEYGTDGTPRGYKVFTKKDGKLKWYYKSVGYSKDHQVQLYMPGQTPYHPNSVVLNVWDWDPEWKVEWYEDGVAKGELKPVIDLSPVYVKEINKVFEGKEIPAYKRPRENYHYFAATPSQYAEKVMICVESRFGDSWVYDVDMSDYVDVQAHRGGAGHMPENTIEAMKHALDMGVNTLELDLQVTADGQVVVSHDTYFHPNYSVRPDGSYVKDEDPKEYIYKMPYSEVSKYDVGTRPSHIWPEKKCIAAVKPLADDLIDFVENYTKEKGYSPVRYNIEIKSKEEDGEGIYWPTYDDFATICARFLHSKHLDDRLVVQSFDVRTLNYLHEKYPEFSLSYLVSVDSSDFDTYMSKLEFTPKWLSPHFSMTDEDLVRKCREKGMKIVPWTVDNPEDIKRMIDLGVDAIISNYPDRVLMQTRGY